LIGEERTRLEKEGLTPPLVPRLVRKPWGGRKYWTKTKAKSQVEEIEALATTCIEKIASHTGGGEKWGPSGAREKT